MTTGNNYTAFPSPFKPKEEKLQKPYGLEYAKAIWGNYKQGINLYDQKRQRDIVSRKYTEGLQSIQKNKDLLDLNGDTSYLNLDFTPINRIATIVDNIVGKMMNQNYKIQCNPLDTESKTKFDEYRKKLYAKMFLAPVSKELEKYTGIPIVPTNEKLPETNEEAELHLKLNYKNDASAAMEQALHFVFMNNLFDDTRRAILKDLISIKRAAIYRYYDENFNLRVDYADPIDIITPYSKYEDFRNIPYQAILKKYTIGEIAEMNTDFTDQQLFEIAKSQEGKNGNPSWTYGLSYEGYYASNGGILPYYNFNIPVMEFFFLSPCDEVRVKKEKSKGGFFFDNKSEDYKIEVDPFSFIVIDKGDSWAIKGEDFSVSKNIVPEKEKARIYLADLKTKKRSEKINVIKKKIQYRFEGKWIPDTEYIWDYGMSKNVPREKINGSYNPKVELPIAIIAPDIYDMENKSLVERMIPFEDQLNLAHLKFQQHLIKLKPPGVAIDVRGIQNAISAMNRGQGDGKMRPTDLIKIYEQTGSFPYSSVDEEGNVINNAVITPLDNGIGTAFNALLATHNHYIELMNQVIGFNSAVDASSPNSEALVGTQKMAVQATNNALRPIYFYHIRLIEKTAKQLALMIQDSIEYNYEAFVNAIGEQASDVIKLGKSLAFNQFAIKIELLPDDEEKMFIENQMAMAQQAGTLTSGDIFRIRQILKQDVKLAAQLMTYLEDKNRKNKMEESAALQEQNAQVQAQAAQQAAQAELMASQQIEAEKRKTLELEYALKSQLSAQENTQMLQQIEKKNQGIKDVAHIKEDGKVVTETVKNSFAQDNGLL